MAIGKTSNKTGKGGRKGAKKKVVESMLRKEWYDVVAPTTFKTRNCAKALCNKTQGLKIAADNLKGRVYEINQAELDDASNKEQPFRRIKLEVKEVQGRSLLTQFHSLNMTNDKMRSQLRKWCTLIESVVTAKTADGFTFRLFITAFTTKQPGQLSKNCYAPTRLAKWVRHRITKMVQKKLSKCTIDQAVTQLTSDALQDSLHRRCNPIIPLRDVKVTKVKVIREPKLDMQKLFDSHGVIPASLEGEARIVEEPAVEVAAEAPAAAAAPAAKAAAKGGDDE
jgi:small subunit ribosomal protein S3Ae